MGDNMGIQLLYHLLNNEFVEKSEQCYATSSLFQMCCSKVNRMLEDQILNDIQQQSDQEEREQQQQQQGQVVGPDGAPLLRRASLCGKSEFEMQVVRRLPGEVRERLHTEKRVCERMGCKRAFYGEGRMRRTYYQRAPKPKSARGASTESHADGSLDQTATAPPAAATPQAAASDAAVATGDENGRAGPAAAEAAAAAANQVAVQGEPVHLSFCSKECWATFPQTFEEAMRNAMSLP
jgi:hypothetical protein